MPVSCDSTVAMGTPPELEARRAPRCRAGTSGTSAAAMSRSSVGIGLEAVLVEVLVAHHAGAQHELAGDVRRRVDRRAASAVRSVVVRHRAAASHAWTSARRTASRRSTSCRWACSHAVPIASWSTRPTASGARPRAAVAACASGAGSRSSPYAAKHSSPSHTDRNVRRLGPERQRVGIDPRRERADDLLPEVVVREVARQPVPRDRVQPPLEALIAAGTVVGDPGLRAVEVAVDRWTEVLVEREHERRRRRARRRWRCGTCAAAYRTLLVAVPCLARRGGVRTKSRIGTVWCGLVIVLMAGCGGGGGRLSSPGYVRRASRICVRANRAVARVTLPPLGSARCGRARAGPRRGDPAVVDRRPARPPSAPAARRRVPNGGSRCSTRAPTSCELMRDAPRRGRGRSTPRRTRTRRPTLLGRAQELVRGAGHDVVPGPGSDDRPRTLGPMAPAAGYDRLTALDESFLHLERPETPMHVGAVAVLEREPFYDARGSVPPRRRCGPSSRLACS